MFVTILWYLYLLSQMCPHLELITLLKLLNKDWLFNILFVSQCFCSNNTSTNSSKCTEPFYKDFGTVDSVYNIVWPWQTYLINGSIYYKNASIFRRIFFYQRKQLFRYIIVHVCWKKTNDTKSVKLMYSNTPFFV